MSQNSRKNYKSRDKQRKRKKGKNKIKIQTKLKSFKRLKSEKLLPEKFYNHNYFSPHIKKSISKNKFILNSNALDEYNYYKK